MKRILSFNGGHSEPRWIPPSLLQHKKTLSQEEQHNLKKPLKTKCRASIHFSTWTALLRRWCIWLVSCSCWVISQDSCIWRFLRADQEWFLWYSFNLNPGSLFLAQQQIPIQIQHQNKELKQQSVLHHWHQVIIQNIHSDIAPLPEYRTVSHWCNVKKTCA